MTNLENMINLDGILEKFLIDPYNTPGTLEYELNKEFLQRKNELLQIIELRNEGLTYCEKNNE